MPIVTPIIKGTLCVISAGFRLVIVCSSVDESKSHVISKLHLYRRAYHRQEDLVLKDFLGKHITTQSRARSKTTQVTASSVDKDL